MAESFEQAWYAFISKHSIAREGERQRRLTEGHDHAEKLFLKLVWWPAFGHFEHLHPEFEVYDFKDGSRYLDFAYIRSGIRLAVEIDGYGPHVKNASRWQFSDHCRRQNDLVIDGWKVLRFTYDDVKDNPRACQQKIQQFMGRYYGEDRSFSFSRIGYKEREVVRLALRLNHPITPSEVSVELGLCSKTSRKLLRQLAGEGWLVPARGKSRIRAYRLHAGVMQIQL